MAAPKQTDPQFKLRMTPEIKERIEKAADQSGRSMNAEILARLETSFREGATEGKDIVQALLLLDDTPKDNKYRKAVETMALLYYMDAPERELNAALRTVVQLRDMKKDRGDDGQEMAKRLERSVRPMLDVIADYMRRNGWSITPPAVEDVGETDVG